MGVFGVAIKRQPFIPQGLIVPFDDTSIPDGWTRFTSSDDKRIIGAGTTYNPGDTGGDNNLTISSKTSDTVGDHLGHSSCPGPSLMGGTGSGIKGGSTNAGDHSHDFSKSSSPLEPDYRQLLLIKSSSSQDQFPAKALVNWHLTGSNPTGLSQQYTGEDDTLIRAGASITTGGTDSITGVTSTSNGSHSHGTLGGTCCPWDAYSGQNAGSHSHNVTMNFTFAMKRKLLGLWTNAAANFDIETNMIGMYESLTPPNNWYLCDGSNGTPDMRDFMVGIANQANQGTNDGDNTSSCTHSSDSWLHGHCDPQLGYNIGSGTPGVTYDAAHAHSLDFNSGEYFPSYYALSFIMYGG